MNDRNTIVIKVQDDTSDSRFSTNVEIEENIVKTATQAKTDTKENSSNGVKKTIVKQTANQITGGKIGQIEGVISAVGNPVAIATLALTATYSLWKKFREMEKRQEETEMVKFRSGGINRISSTVNGTNSRINFITGRVMMGNSTVYRR